MSGYTVTNRCGARLSVGGPGRCFRPARKGHHCGLHAPGARCVALTATADGCANPPRKGSDRCHAHRQATE